jgi:hypothetical protein
MWWKAQKLFIIFSAELWLFSCFLLSVRRFFQKNPYIFLCNFMFWFLIKNPSSPTCQTWPHLLGPGPPVGASQPGWAQPGGSVFPTWPFYASPTPSPLARALAVESQSPPPRSIPAAPVGASRRDGSRSIDLATVHLPIRERLSIAPLCPRLRRLPRLGFRPWRPRASPRAAWPFPLARSGTSVCCALSTSHQRLPLAWCHRGRAGTASPCHGGTSWVLSKSSPSSTPLYISLELALALVLPPDELGFLPHTCHRAIDLKLAVICMIHTQWPLSIYSSCY